jgi:acetyl-CoA carboxylase biotin carboxyl carrier protein
MIDIRKLKELVRLMVENDLTELDLQDQQETVTIKRGPTGAAMVTAPMMPAGTVMAPFPVGVGASNSAAASAGDTDSDGKGDDARDTAGLVAVNSPMVGTAYLAPNPDAPNFVRSGDAVGTETTVCLIEAMKVFSEIKAEMNGTVERVLVSNGQAVQYGQPLFLVRPG